MTTVWLVALASRFALQAQSAKVTSTASIPMCASAAARAPRLAPTRLSPKAKVQALHTRKAQVGLPNVRDGRLSLFLYPQLATGLWQLWPIAPFFVTLPPGAVARPDVCAAPLRIYSLKKEIRIK